MASTSCAFDGDPSQTCSAEEPVRHRVGDPENRHWVRCHLYRPWAGAAGHALAGEPTQPNLPASLDDWFARAHVGHETAKSESGSDPDSPVRIAQDVSDVRVR